MRMLSIGRTEDGFLLADAGQKDADGYDAGQGDMLAAGSGNELRSILNTKYHLPEPQIEQAIVDLKNPLSSTTIKL